LASLSGVLAANKIVGEVGKLYSTLDTPTFWLIHVASCRRTGRIVLFKVLVNDRMVASHAAAAQHNARSS
jgi:hypothetical protein